MENSEIQQNNFIDRAQEKKYLYVVIVLSLIISFPVLYSGYPVDGHDSPFHFNVYGAFSRQLWAGEPYPRWLIDINSGFGSPVFFFYQPVAFYVAAFFSLILGQPTTDGMVWQQLGLSAASAIIGSGVACYLWLKEITNHPAAAIASVIYLIVPYHLSVDLFTRAAFSEFWGFVWMPLTLKFVKVIYEKPVYGLIGLALSYALLVMTHLPTTLIFSPVLVCYGIFLESDKARIFRFVLMSLGMAIGIGIASVYLLPAMAMRSYISMEPNPVSYLYYTKHFLFPIFPQSYSPFIYYLTVLLATMICGTVISALTEKNLKFLNCEQQFWLAVAVLSIFMMTPYSKTVWQLIPTIQSIQFPFRINSVLCVAYAGLVAVTLSKISFSKQYFVGDWRRNLFVYGTAVLCCVWIGILIKAVVTEKPSEHKNYIEKMYTQKLEFAENMPKTARLGKLTSLIEERRESGSPYFLKVGNGETPIEVIKWNPRDINLKITATEPTNLIVGQFYYPGWKANFYPDSGEKTVDLTVVPSADGLISIGIPEGSGTVDLKLTNQFERMGTITSLASLAVLGITGLGLNVFKKRLRL